eukprot:TRINITY_DN14640_c0_g1_i1.p1 TRINITY_DN14640_c0_g1~~TRINITY_DN14640_c0_g1_i1.p1  ORF type:complete len:751 (+),score=148.35 TRINITY_DN14640_c0_g1_i1:44-2296(+)
MPAAVGEYLAGLLASTPMVEEVSLAAMDISDLSPLLPNLFRFPNLRILNLSHNNLQGLPVHMGGLQQLEYLDITNNPLTGHGAILPGLASLPNLRHLNADLPLESQEDEVILGLPQLESFNGTPLTDDADESAEDEFDNGSPSNALAAPFLQGSAQSANQLYYPEHGKIRAARPAESQLHHPGVAAADMERVQQLYAAASNVTGQTPNPHEFQQYTANVVQHLARVLSGEEDEFMREAEILKAKQLMYEYCFEEVARSSYAYDPTLSGVLNTLYVTYSELLGSWQRLTKGMQEDRDQKLAAMRGDMQHAIQEIEHLMQHMDRNKVSLDADERQQFKVLQQENRSLAETVQTLTAEKELLQTQLRQQRKQQQIERTRERDRSESPVQSETPRTAEPSSAPLTYAAAHAKRGGQPTALQQHLQQLQQQLQLQQQQLLSKGTSGSTGTHQGLHGEQSPAPTASSARPTPGKNLTLRQLKDAIEDIYSSKSKFDVKCSESGLPRETMEQHLYTYLNQKYGLKSLILDWAQSIIAAVRRYGTEDTDVAIFGRILRNEIDEEFRFVARQLKETVHDLLKVYLRGKYPLKSEQDITQLLKKRINGVVHEEEWVDIIKYMYNADDAMNVMLRLKDCAVVQDPSPGARPSPSANGRGRSAAKVIPYQDFIQVLLEFQLTGHEKFLVKFVRLFRQCDTDRNGIINEAEFRQLLRLIDPEKPLHETEQLVRLIDPHNNQQITFSECVTFLSSELVSLLGGT